MESPQGRKIPGKEKGLKQDCVDKPFDWYTGLEESSAHLTGSSGLSIRSILRGPEVTRPLLGHCCGLSQKSGAWLGNLVWPWRSTQESNNHLLCIWAVTLSGRGIWTAHFHVRHNRSASLIYKWFKLQEKNYKFPGIYQGKTTRKLPLPMMDLGFIQRRNKGIYFGVIFLSKACLKDIVEGLMS